MKVIYHTKYGAPHDLETRDLPTPVPGENEVRVKVKSASINATDFEIIRGDFIVKLANGIRRPRNWRLGCDFSGTVDQIGKNVKNFDVGEEVYADLMYNTPPYGAFSEYVILPSKRLRKKPSHLSFYQAATIPQAGVLAVQGMRNYVEIGEGSEVLVNGAGGGVGSYAVQIAKYFGAEVTGVDSAEKSDFVRDLGADNFIDYRVTDFTKTGKKYDLVVDVIAKRGFFAHRKVLKPDGHYRMVGGSLGKIIQNGVFGGVGSMLSSKKVGLLFGGPNNETDMDFLSELIRTGDVDPKIDKVYDFNETVEAISYVQEGRSLGKVVINLD